jgi:hypothetical protein
MLSCFRLMTQDYWENLYLLVLTAAGRYHFFYFVAVIFFGSFYLVNLILAIVSMSYQDQQKKVKAETEERERRKVKDELEEQNEVARKASELEGVAHYDEENIENALFFENPNGQLSYSSLSLEYDDQNRLGKHKQSIQTSPLLFENSSYIFSNPTTVYDEHQSYDTTIPFFDETQQNSISARSHETLSKQRTRNWSHISERLMEDQQSTVTVNAQLLSECVNRNSKGRLSVSASPEICVPDFRVSRPLLLSISNRMMKCFTSTDNAYLF